jgi:hypothetical protein
MSAIDPMYTSNEDWAIVLEKSREDLVMQCATPRGGSTFAWKEKANVNTGLSNTKSHRHGRLGKRDAMHPWPNSIMLSSDFW